MAGCSPEFAVVRRALRVPHWCNCCQRCTSLNSHSNTFRALGRQAPCSATAAFGQPMVLL
eukprot:1410-Heterococcus_DN1.PRE.9